MHVSQVNVDNPQSVGAQGAKASEKPERTEYLENLSATYCDIFIPISQLKRSMCVCIYVPAPTCVCVSLHACMHGSTHRDTYVCGWRLETTFRWLPTFVFFEQSLSLTLEAITNWLGYLASKP